MLRADAASSRSGQKRKQDVSGTIKSGPTLSDELEQFASLTQTCLPVPITRHAWIVTRRDQNHPVWLTVLLSSRRPRFLASRAPDNPKPNYFPYRRQYGSCGSHAYGVIRNL